MHSDEANSICLPLPNGVRMLLVDIEKALAEAADILGEDPPCGKGPTSKHERALFAGRMFVNGLRTRVRRVLDADTAEHEMGF